MVGYRETNLVNWGSFDDPDYVDYDYRNMTEWGRKRYITPGVAIGGELISTDLVEINLMIRILLGSSYFDSWENEPTLVTHDPLGNPVDKNHPWNKVTLPRPQKRDFTDKYTWVVSPRIYDKRTDTHVCCDTGGGPFARQWCTAKAGLVDFGYAKATGHSIQMVLPRSPNMPEMELEWNVPEKSNAIERDRARTYHQAYSALIALHCLERAMKEVQAGPNQELEQLQGSRQRRELRLSRGCSRRALPPHGHPRRQDRQLPALPADAVERQSARFLRDAGTLRGRRAEHADLRGERSGELQGHRHHARGALVRPVPAVRRAHVQRRRQGAQGRSTRRRRSPRCLPRRCARGRTSCCCACRICRPSSTPTAIRPRASSADELVSAVVQMYGAGLERIVGSLLEGGEEGVRLAGALADDELVAALLLIHDLHPVPLAERVQGALEQVRPYMESHGGNVELLSLQEGVARISLRGSCSDCAASAVTLELAIKQALEEAAPDLEGLEVEGVQPAPTASLPTTGPSLPLSGNGAQPGPSADGAIELPMVMSPSAAAASAATAPAPTPAPTWFDVDHLDLVPVGQMVGAEVGGERLVVANVDGTLLAYASTCAGCGASLEGGELQSGTLACPECSRTYFLPRAGRSMDDERLQLQPVPLLREQGHVKVALAR